MSIEDIRKMKAAYQAKIEAEGKTEIAKEFKVFFDKHTIVEGVRWRQYTPYFNDGDPCTFRIGEFGVKLTGADEEEGDYEDGFVCTPRGHAAVEADFDALIENVNDKDILRCVFGDHAKITATREGFDVEEYDHD